ncbi:hypothetical protein NEMBOFW57_009686 [Staphylotrichum longicolle]|uniref:Uncharacterized protein n=1 Tax=Staphylotrichum longicolle TaxID=669026 RepID=A0AAD4EPS9_9PEZI|nr:hypothetical protein NEMBOFW57_009686 [Staphylotrichum longicolle]
MSRPATPFRRYIQVENIPRSAYTTDPKTDRFVPKAENFTKRPNFASLMKTVYGSTAAPTDFAGFSVEAETYLRARINISINHEVLVLDSLQNMHAGEDGYFKTKDLVAHALSRVGVSNSEVNLIVIPNIDNENTRKAIKALQVADSWEPGTWINAKGQHNAAMLKTELGRTAGSVARKLGKTIGNIYVGHISGQPALGFALAVPGAAAATYPPSRPGTPSRPAAPSRAATPSRQAIPRAPTPVRQNSKTCGCVIC